MKKKNHPLIHAMSEIDEDLLLDAEAYTPSTKNKKKPLKNPRLRALVAACLLLVVIFPIAFSGLEIRSQDSEDVLEKYKDDPYFHVIKVVNRYQELSVPKGESIADREPISTDMQIAPPSDIPFQESVSGQYIDPFFTDTSIEGLSELDRIQISDTHVFFLNMNGVIEVYSPEGETLEKITSIAPESDHLQNQPTTIYLTNQDKTLVALRTNWNEEKSIPQTQLVAYDLTALDKNETKIVKSAETILDGSAVVSRLKGNHLFVACEYYTHKAPDYVNKSFIPQYQTNGKQAFISPENITAPDYLCQTTYTILYQLNESLSVIDAEALMGRHSTVYVTKDTFYLVNKANELNEEGGKPILYEQHYYIGKTVSTILAVGFDESGLEKKGSVLLNGGINSVFAISEQGGVLRVVTSNFFSYFYYQFEFLSSFRWSAVDNANLYLISLEDFSILSSLENFAEEGRRVLYSRFDGDTAYVCTSTVPTHYEYVLDLSDPTNITYTISEDIMDYSTTHIPLDDGNVVTVKTNYGSDGITLNVGAYQIKDGVLGELSLFSQENMMGGTAYREYLIDEANGYFGMSMEKDNYGGTGYLLFKVKDGKLSVLVNEILSEGMCEAGYVRAFIRNGNLYAFSAAGELYTFPIA